MLQFAAELTFMDVKPNSVTFVVMLILKAVLNIFTKGGFLRQFNSEMNRR